jgi:hypothetical protein
MENIEKMLELLPAGFEKAANETGALKRKREIKTAADLLRLVFLYVVQGLSYLEVSVIAKTKGIAQISDVGFMKRFAKCDKLIDWLLEKLTPQATAHYKKPEKFVSYEIKALDASVVTSGGKVRITHRLHYAIDIFNLKSDQYKITSQKTGESLTNFKIKPHDLYLGDRAYGTKTSMEHCLCGSGNFIFRIRKNAFDIYDKNNNKIDLIGKLRRIKKGKTLSFCCYFIGSKKSLVPIRICVMLKPKDVAEAPEDDTEFMNNYIVVVTSITDKNISTKDILDLYRLRWQVELYFKRLKTLMGFGDIPNKTEKNIKTWLNTKLAAAILLEIMIAQVDFSPSWRRC